MFTQLEKICCLIGIATAIVLASSSFATAQTIRNGEFDQNSDWWFPFGDFNVERTTTGFESVGGCAVTNRTAFWQGAGQEMMGSLEPGKDYHIEGYVRPAPGQSGTMRIGMYQTDDRGDLLFEIGDAVCLPDQWTRIQGGFTYDPQGDVEQLILVFNNSRTDLQHFDYILDSVKVTENDWRDEANDRIEQIRKRDVALSFVRSNGQPATDLSISASQVSHAFPFGCTLNDAFINNETYRDFFREHFNFATIEWFSQWKPTEKTQGVEDYTIADASVEFCQQNGIRVKAHALFWGNPDYRPSWLDQLGDGQLLGEMEERVTNAVSRFKSKAIGWDVNNEMLNFEYFQGRLGQDIRTWAFQRAREIDPQAKLFVNEFGIINYEAKARRYRELVDSLLANGAPVDGIGFQSHLDGMASPKGLEIAMDQFQDSGLGIWFTEYDTSHSNPNRRARALEDFYRYTFSRPETKGITMWGFWAGTHWRGADASIVDLDWTLNAAGQRYVDLRNEWSTDVEGSSGGSGQFAFRGFMGSYLVETTDAAGIANYHIVPVDQGEGVATATLVANPFNKSLSIYGTPEDDVFEFDSANPDVVMINGSATKIDLPVDATDIRFVGLSGNDRVDIKAPAEPQFLLVNENRLIVRDPALTVRFQDMETISVIAESVDSRITVTDSAADDVFESFENSSTMTSANTEVVVSGFGMVNAHSNFGNDVARIFDSPSIDKFTTDLHSVNVVTENATRQTVGFSQNLIESSIGLDTLLIQVGDEEKSIDVSPLLIAVNADEEQTGDQFEFSGFLQATFIVDEENSETINIVGNEEDETIRIAPNGSLYFGSGFRYVFDKDFRSFESSTDSPGEDRLVFRDTPGNETLSVAGNQCTIEGSSGSHSFQFLDAIFAFSREGGTDTATTSNPVANVRLFGDWNANQF